MAVGVETVCVGASSKIARQRFDIASSRHSGSLNRPILSDWFDMTRRKLHLYVRVKSTSTFMSNRCLQYCQYLNNQKCQQLVQRFRSVLVMALASHARGRGSKPGGSNLNFYFIFLFGLWINCPHNWLVYFISPTEKLVCERLTVVSRRMCNARRSCWHRIRRGSTCTGVS